jgi:branched-chain amino acid transport system substrate-binding protein
MWKQIPSNKKIGVMYPNDADGNAIRDNLAPLLEKGGYTIIDPGAYEDGTTDYSAQIQKFKDEGVEMFNTFPIPPDFAAFWRQAAQQGLTRQIKIAQIAKTGLFPSDIEAVGDLGDKLATAAYWHWTFPYKSSLTGVSGEELASGYETTAGKQRQQQLGASMALLDGGFAALAASSNPNDKAAVAKALSTLNTVTMVGKVDFTSGPVPNVSEAPIIGAQWVKSQAGSKFPFDLVIVDNAPDPNVPVAAKLVPYNAWREGAALRGSHARR